MLDTGMSAATTTPESFARPSPEYITPMYHRYHDPARPVHPLFPWDELPAISRGALSGLGDGEEAVPPEGEANGMGTGLISLLAIGVVLYLVMKKS